MKDAISLTDSFAQTLRRLQPGLLAAAILAGGMSSAQATEPGGDSYSMNALFNPSPELLRAESRGRVTIYDGLYDRAVDQALDSQFHRIQSMMFVNTQYEQPDGAVLEDDDCD